jgi:hypothetical protein
VSFEYTHDEVINKFERLIDKSIAMFNDFETTHFLEFRYNTLLELEKINKSHWLRLNELFLNTNVVTFPNDYFSNVCPSIITEIADHIHNIRSTLNIADKNEEQFLNLKSKVIRHVAAHYFEIEECLKIFDPCKEIINNQLLECIQIFHNGSTIDYNKTTNFLENIRTHQMYISTLPRFVNLFNLVTLLFLCSRYEGCKS